MEVPEGEDGSSSYGRPEISRTDAPTASELVAGWAIAGASPRAWAAWFEALPQPTLVVDGASRIVVANAAARGLFDASGHVMTGYAAARFVDEKQIEQARLALRGQSGLYAYREVLALGAVDVPVAIQARHVVVDGNEYIVLAIADRTAERRERAEWAQAQTSELKLRSELPLAQLRQAQHFEVLGHLAGTLAHDFNNLLSVILGSLETARRKAAAGLDVKSELERATLAAERSMRTTDEVLNYSRKRTVVPRGVDPALVIESMRGLLERALDGHGDLAVEVDAGLELAVEPTQFETAVLNLVVNARDALTEGGLVTIRCRQRMIDDPMASRHGLLPGAYVSVAVRDNGLGMSPEVLERAFDPFFTTKPEGEGTGLGLSTVRAFVQRHGGVVLIDSAEQKGTEVELLLPRRADSSPSSAAP